jgi:hypothetical protein
MCLLLLLFSCFEPIITTQTSQRPIGTLKTLVCSDSCIHRTHSVVVASLSFVWASDQGTSLRLHPNSITRIIPRKSASQGCCQLVGKSAHYVSNDTKSCSLCTLNRSASLKLQVPTILVWSITKSRDYDLHYCKSILS